MKNVRELVLVSLFAAITCILSIVSIPLPFTPVPITLQLLAVTMSSAVLGKRLGFYSQAQFQFPQAHKIYFILCSVLPS